MKTLLALTYIFAIVFMSFFMLPIAYILDSISGLRKYTFFSMIIDVVEIVADIWATRSQL